MPDARIPEDLILRVSRSIGEIEDVREQASEDLKVTWADMREELKGLGLTGKEVSAEVGFLKAAIAETRKSAEDHAKAETKAEGVEGYLEILNSPRARARARKPIQPGASSNGNDDAAEGLGKVGARAGGATPPTGSTIQPETAVADEPDGETDAAGDFEREVAQSDPAHLIGGNIVADGSSRSTNSPKTANAAGSSSGRTADFGSANEGSNPSPATKIIEGMTEALAVARGEAEPAAIYTFTRKPHDGPYSSNGLPRPKGCQHVDACAGMHSKRCYGCERAWTTSQSQPESAA